MGSERAFQLYFISKPTLAHRIHSPIFEAMESLAQGWLQITQRQKRAVRLRQLQVLLLNLISLKKDTEPR